MCLRALVIDYPQRGLPMTMGLIRVSLLYWSRKWVTTLTNKKQDSMVKTG